MSALPGVIEAHLKTAEQLFNSFDPSPFHERDLDEEAERYIVGWAREIREKATMKLIVTGKTGTSRTPAHWLALPCHWPRRPARMFSGGLIHERGVQPIHRREIDGTEPSYPGLGGQLEATGDISLRLVAHPAAGDIAEAPLSNASGSPGRFRRILMAQKPMI